VYYGWGFWRCSAIASIASTSCVLLSQAASNIASGTGCALPCRYEISPFCKVAREALSELEVGPPCMHVTGPALHSSTACTAVCAATAAVHLSCFCCCCHMSPCQNLDSRKGKL
jgi:hypothetical protein